MTALLKLIFIEIKGSKLRTTEICSHEKYLLMYLVKMILQYHVSDLKYFF